MAGVITKLNVPAQPAWLSPTEAAQIMGVKPPCVRGLINSGCIKAVKFNSRLIRIPVSELNRLKGLAQ